MRKNKNTSKIILVFIVAIIATLVAYSAFNKMNRQIEDQNELIDLMETTKSGAAEDNYTYAVAVKDLKAGEVVSDEDVDFKEFSAINNASFDNRSDVVNKVLLTNIAANEPFTTNHIAKISSDNTQLRAGYRALTLPAENFNGKSSAMTLGTNVDIFSSASDNGWTMDGVKLLAFEGGDTAASKDITKAKSITFEVNANDIADFIANASKDKMVLVQRSPNDKVVKRHKASHSASSSGFGNSSLPNLPSDVPIADIGKDGLSGLPQPIEPQIQTQDVELIEANVKTKVSF